MKIIAICMCCLILPALAKQAPAEPVKLPEGYAFEDRPFDGLEEHEAKKQAVALAERDLEKGITRIFVYGLRRGQSADERYLAKQYGVYHVAIAGCKVTEGLLAGAKAYNDVVRAHLLKKHGKDIFVEARQQNSDKS